MEFYFHQTVKCVLKLTVIQIGPLPYDEKIHCRLLHICRRQSNILESEEAVSKFSAEYRVMACTSCEITWIKYLLKDFGIEYNEPMKLYYDDEATFYISANPFFHEITKHIKINCHIIREKIQNEDVRTKYVQSMNQLLIFLLRH